MANTVRRMHDTLKNLPGGMWLFSKAIGYAAPYTGTLGAQIVHLETGYSKVQLRDRRGVRNHLESIHAVALMNLAELSTGVAFVYGLPEDARSILTGLSIEYLKKARGTLTAECRCVSPDASVRQEYEIVGEIRDESGDLVARAKARWLVGPKKER